LVDEPCGDLFFRKACCKNDIYTRNVMKHIGKRGITAKELTGKQEEEFVCSIDEVATLFDVNTWTIRFWANRFKQLKPCQGANGDILFSNEDVECIGLIHNLSKERGITIKKVCELLKRRRSRER